MAFIKVVISLFLVSIIFIFIGNQQNDFDNIQYSENSNTFYAEIHNHTKIIFDRCDLPELDPWDTSILRFLNPNKDSTKNCKIAIEQRTKLIDGQLFVYLPPKVNVTCNRRCLYPESDYSLKWGEWKRIENGSRPQCDIIEVECNEFLKNGTSQIYYRFLHSHIYRQDLPAEEPSTDKPDVHIILFDSVSESQFVRSMQKTRHILREYYETISFRHLNKVGLNSRPNGFALLLGKAIYSIQKSPISRGLQSDFVGDAYCRKPIDNNQFIGFRFQDDGYVSMMSEDWALGVFNWPSCRGFAKKPTDHYMRPFQLRVEGGKKWKLPGISGIIHNKMCRETFHHQMDYLQSFLNAYPDKPKFSLTWMSYLAHNDQNALYHTDEYFYNFFKTNKQKFNNSFILFMGDHGNRFGALRKTGVGEAEDNNPFLFLSLPAKFRRNSTYVDILRQNFANLITHFDIYATLKEITNPTLLFSPHLRGSSLFHPLPQPRTCDQLGIPFQYCICKPKKTTLPKNNKIAQAGAEIMLAKMNLDLQESNETSECLSLELDPKFSIKVDEFEEKESVKVYQLTYRTLPGAGEFWGYLTQLNDNGTLHILSEKFPRLNAYAAQSGCASKSAFASYCFCRNLLNVSSSTASSTPSKIPFKSTTIFL